MRTIALCIKRWEYRGKNPNTLEELKKIVEMGATCCGHRSLVITLLFVRGLISSLLSLIPSKQHSGMLSIVYSPLQVRSVLPENPSSGQTKKFQLYVISNSIEYSFIASWGVNQLFSERIWFKKQPFQVSLQICCHTIKSGSRVGKLSEEHSLQNVSFTNHLLHKPQANYIICISYKWYNIII